MLGVHDLWLFILSGLILNITPGPDTFYILGRSIAQGRRAGLLSVLGISSGILVHTIAAGAGLSAILARSAAAFTIIRYIGAAYLFYLGIRLLLTSSGSKPSNTNSIPHQISSSWTIYRQGLLTNMLNPKVALFFLAFLPQFVQASSPHRMAAFLLLGLIFVFNGALYCLMLVYFAAGLSSRFRQRPSATSLLNRLCGVLFVGLGLKVARG